MFVVGNNEQTIDITNPDTLLNKGWATDSKEKEILVADLKLGLHNINTKSQHCRFLFATLPADVS